MGIENYNGPPALKQTRVTLLGNKPESLAPDRVLAILGNGETNFSELRVDTAAGNWYLIEKRGTVWVVKKGTGGIPVGTHFSMVQDGKLITHNSTLATYPIQQIYITDDRGRALQSLN